MRDPEEIKKNLLGYYEFNASYKQQTFNGERSVETVTATKRIQSFKDDETIPGIITFRPPKTGRIVTTVLCTALLCIPLLSGLKREEHAQDLFLGIAAMALIIIPVIYRLWFGAGTKQILTLDARGLHYCGVLYAWQDILLTYTVYESFSHSDHRCFLELGMSSGDICRCDITCLEFGSFWQRQRYTSLRILGHYIEVYKARYSTQVLA